MYVAAPRASRLRTGAWHPHPQLWPTLPDIRLQRLDGALNLVNTPQRCADTAPTLALVDPTVSSVETRPCCADTALTEACSSSLEVWSNPTLAETGSSGSSLAERASSSDHPHSSRGLVTPGTCSSVGLVPRELA